MSEMVSEQQRHDMEHKRADLAWNRKRLDDTVADELALGANADPIAIPAPALSVAYMRKVLDELELARAVADATIEHRVAGTARAKHGALASKRARQKWTADGHDPLGRDIGPVPLAWSDDDDVEHDRLTKAEVAAKKNLDDAVAGYASRFPLVVLQVIA